MKVFFIQHDARTGYPTEKVISTVKNMPDHIALSLGDGRLGVVLPNEDGPRVVRQSIYDTERNLMIVSVAGQIEINVQKIYALNQPHNPSDGDAPANDGGTAPPAGSQ